VQFARPGAIQVRPWVRLPTRPKFENMAGVIDLMSRRRITSWGRFECTWPRMCISKFRQIPVTKGNGYKNHPTSKKFEDRTPRECDRLWLVCDSRRDSSSNGKANTKQPETVKLRWAVASFRRTGPISKGIGTRGIFKEKGHSGFDPRA